MKRFSLFVFIERRHTTTNKWIYFQPHELNFHLFTEFSLPFDKLLLK